MSSASSSSRRVALAGLLGAVLFPSIEAAAGDRPNLRELLVESRRNAVADRALGAEPGLVQPKIIGGTPAAPGAWPFIAAVVTASDPVDFSAQFCGATLIAAEWVLTAAHCVADIVDPAEVAILVGTQRLSSTATSSGTRYPVDSIAVHPLYDDATSDYDVAVLHLATPVPSPTVVPLLTAAKAGLADPNDAAVAIGWGDTDKSSKTRYPNDLMQVDLPIVSTSSCNGKKSYRGAITAQMLCAGPSNGKKDSCQGDSGGPLVVEDTTTPDTVYYQAGIVSWGRGCARKKFPGVYTRVTAVEPWVTGVMTGPGVAVSSRDCRRATVVDRTACLKTALAGSEGRMAGFLSVLRSRTDAAQRSAVEVSQTAWSGSLTGICRFAEMADGSAGRLRCMLDETERRIAALGRMTAELRSGE